LCKQTAGWLYAGGRIHPRGCHGGLLVQPASAGEISCRVSFQLSGWSVFHMTASGTGWILGVTFAAFIIK
jgi:hypothetical protein